MHPDLNSPNPFGLCMCGCGRSTPIALTSQRGLVPGQPTRWLKGHHDNAPFAGRKHSDETKAKVAAAKRGNLNPNWKGDDCAPDGLHTWLIRNYPKRGICEDCGVCRKTDYANVSGSYTRARGDYRELCRPCHIAFDAEIRPKDAKGRWALAAEF